MWDDGVNNTFRTNYWNEWITSDEDANGIVDTHYLIDGAVNNTDPSPLTSSPVPLATTMITTPLANTTKESTTPACPLLFLLLSLIVVISVRKKGP